VSIGFACRPFVRNATVPNGKRLAGSHQNQRQAICAALDFAGRQLSLVASAAGGEAAQIPEFQVALLEDEEALVVVSISSSRIAMRMSGCSIGGFTSQVSVTSPKAGDKMCV
jgi:hypothetical protein